MDDYAHFMKRALALARRGEGLTRPNPPVGAVLVKNGKIISEGFHKKAGLDHAERVCLKNLKPNAQSLRSSTLYVTLEPCSTCGKTPPCTDMIIAAGIRRVVVGAKDPNPAHAGRGLRQLRRAGVEVITGVCREEAEALIAPFSKWIRTGRPYVTLKLGMTLDGRLADASGRSKWITGPQSRAKVQELRRAADAILVGAGTVRADNPSLLPRPAKGRAPWRVVAGSDIPKKAKVLTDEAAERTLIFSMEGHRPRCLRTARPPSLQSVLKDLGKRGILHVLCEGGGELAGALVCAGLVDEFAIFMAPSLLGGDGVPAFGKAGWALAKMPRLVIRNLEKCGEDVLMRAVPVREK